MRRHQGPPSGPIGPYAAESAHILTGTLTAVWFFATGRTVQRTYEATGDGRIAAYAGLRGLVRWHFFVLSLGAGLIALITTQIFGIAVMLQIAHLPAQRAAHFLGTEPVYARPTIPSTYQTLVSVTAFYVGWALTWLVYPFGLGVLWVRFADRSLLQVNRSALYRWLLPFAHVVRKLPDWVLFCGWLYPWLIALPISVFA